MKTKQKSSIDQQYKTLALRFKVQHGAHEALAKIGHMPAGSSNIEKKIFNDLQSLKPIILKGDPLTVSAKMSSIDGMLKDYEEWIVKSNNTLTPYGLRQYIQQDELKRKDLLKLARYLSEKKSSQVDDRGKLELLVAELCKELTEEEEQALLNELFPDPPQLTYAVQETIDQLRSLTIQIESLTKFPDLIEGEFMTRARRLKMELGPAIWHPEVFSVLSALNLSLESSFRNLFNAERRFIADACRKLADAGINSVGKLGESGVLNVDAASRFADNADGLLEQNYQTNFQRLQQLARIGQWLRNALETLEGRTLPKPAVSKVQGPKPAQQRDSKLAPISTVLDYANVGAMEQQLTDRVEEISQILLARPRRSGVEVIQLKRTVMLLGEWEIQSMVSLGNVVKSARRQQNDLIRRSIALVSELQESAVVFKESKNTKSSRSGNLRSSHHYSVPATVYFLEQTKRAEGELETASQLARQDEDIEMALNLLATRSKLQDAYQKIAAQFKEAGLDLQ